MTLQTPFAALGEGLRSAAAGGIGIGMGINEIAMHILQRQLSYCRMFACVPTPTPAFATDSDRTRV